MPRRRMLMRLLAWLSAGPTLGIACRHVPKTVTDPERIVVVGAGMAGLTAARLLHDAGHEVVVLEARDRLGGRIHTSAVGPATVDLGGATLHGVRGNPVATFAKAHGLTFTPRGIGLPWLFDAEGRAMDEAARKAYIRELDRLWSTGHTVWKENREATVAEALERHLAELTDPIIDKDHLRHFAKLLIENDVAGPLDDLTLAGLHAYEELGGGNQIPDGGYGRVIDQLAVGLEVHTQTTVVEIDGRDRQLKVVDDRGDTTFADRVIVTLPLGVLKASTVQFWPVLSRDKVRAIGKLGVAQLEKVILVYDDRWWDPPVDTRRMGIVTPDYSWAYAAFDDYSAFTGAPTLVGWIGGGSARPLLDTTSDEAIIASAHQRLARLFPGRAPERPVAATVTRWGDDVYARGAYSNVRRGAVPGDFDKVGAPEWNGRLLFAGEATINHAYQSVHGAMMTGIREAERVLQLAERRAA